jgi:MFS-type transporter involved in bile tolerance (Atg22 family)
VVCIAGYFVVAVFALFLKSLWQFGITVSLTGSVNIAVGFLAVLFVIGFLILKISAAESEKAKRAG